MKFRLEGDIVSTFISKGSVIHFYGEINGSLFWESGIDFNIIKGYITQILEEKINVGDIETYPIRMITIETTDEKISPKNALMLDSLLGPKVITRHPELKFG